MASAQPATRQHGVVKQVLSGDTVVIRGPARGGPPPERTLSIAGITAPRLGRRPTEKDDGGRDEPWAWASREYLRKKLVGKDVTFTVDYKVPNGREFGTIFLATGPGEEENVTKSIIRDGMARVREGARGDNPDMEEFSRLATVASDNKIGVYAPESAVSVRNCNWTQENQRALIDSAKGKPYDAIIEQVRDASTIRAFLFPGFQYVTVMLTGIKTPGFKRKEDGTEAAEPFAEQAKFFVESRLLQKEVRIVLEGVQSQTGTNYLGTILHPAGNISELLLAEGFARINDGHIGSVTADREKYRAAEQAAKAKKLRLWANYTPPTANLDIKDKSFTGVVEEIVNPECLVVRTAAGASRKIFLASVRQPRVAKAEGEAGAAAAAKKRGLAAMWEIPYMFEAREFLRKKLIGQKVKVDIDYVKPAAEGFPEKHCATVMVGDIDIGEALISKGLATAVRHRQDDDQRSAHYDNLLAAETRAQKNAKGVHSPKEPSLQRVNDLTQRENKAVADRLLPSLQRAGRTTAVVEFVASGSRLRLYVPKESCILSLVLAGVACPRSGYGDQPSEPFGDEAAAFARQLLLQHEVEVEIESIDKTGNFVGHIFIDGQSLSVALIQRGLSSMHSSADRYKNYSALLAAETEAKAAKKGLYAFLVEKKPEEVVEIKERRTDFKRVIVTEVTSATKFWVQVADNGPQIDAMMAALTAAFRESPPMVGAYTSKKNELCASKFSADGQWYRARVLKVTGRDAEVLYVDYGNTETVPASSLAALPSGTASLAPQARELNLAFVNAPLEDWASEAAEYVRDLILNKTFLCNVEYKTDAGEFATLLDEKSKIDAATLILAEGYVTMQKRREAYLAPLMAEYQKAQSHASSTRAGMWIHGDVTPDDDREFGMHR